MRRPLTPFLFSTCRCSPFDGERPEPMIFRSQWRTRRVRMLRLLVEMEKGPPYMTLLNGHKSGHRFSCSWRIFFKVFCCTALDQASGSFAEWPDLSTSAPDWGVLASICRQTYSFGMMEERSCRAALLSPHRWRCSV